MKATDISDDTFLGIVTAYNERTGRWALVGDVEAALPDVPAKVIRAKAAKLIRRGLLEGCACGCRGDFYTPGVLDGRWDFDRLIPRLTR